MNELFYRELNKINANMEEVFQASYVFVMSGSIKKTVKFIRRLRTKKEAKK